MKKYFSAVIAILALLFNSFSVSANSNTVPTSTSFHTSENRDGCVVGYIDCSSTCAGLCNGAIDLHVISGSGIFTYLWNTGATSEDLANVCAGVYVVTVTDASGCTKLFATQVQEYPQLTLVTSVTNVLCGVCNGTIDLTVNGNSSNLLHYAWSNGSTAEDLSGLCAGGYSVTVSNTHNCSATTAAEVGQTGSPAFTLSTDSIDASNCNPDGCNGAAFVNVTGGAGPFTYAWSSGATTSESWELCGGDYTVTVSDAVGCSKSAVATVICLPGKLEVNNISSDGLNIFPNPFSEQTTLNFTATENGTATLEISDITGALLRVVYSGAVNAGEKYSFNLDTAELPSGIYLCHLNSSSGIEMKRMVKIY